MPRAVNLLAILALILSSFAPGGPGAAFAQEDPSPFLRAFPDGNAVDGGNWPLGATVHLAIDDPATTEIAPDYEQDATVIVSPWDWISTYVEFNFDGVYDLKRGDEVTLTSGEISRYLIVPDLWVTTVDPETNIVAGTLGGAEPGTQVHVFIGGDAQLYVTTDSEGAWVADFDDVGFDLQPGMSGAAEVWFDEFGDSTIFNWSAPPPPRIVASEAGNWFWTADFNPGTLYLSIYESADEGAPLLWSGQRVADQSGFVIVDDHGLDLVPGNYVVVSDGVNEKGVVLETITMEVFDTENEIMAGTAPLGREVWAAAGPQDWQERIMVQADPVNGVWRADFKSIGFDITEDMRPWSYAHIYDEDGDANEAGTPPPLPSTWRDDFDTGALLPGWYWQNGDSGEWSLGDGFLRIYASDTPTPDGNLLLRGAASGDFVIKTRLLFEPDTNFQFAGLVIWQDENNFLQLGRAFCDIPDICVGNGLYFDKILGGNFTDSNFATSVGNPSDVYLRLERRGDMVRAFYSLDEGISWYEIGTHWIPSDFQVNGVGLMASQDFDTPDWDIPADFDFFELTEGWGFLPEGFHDYDQGDVPSWACNAGGWAADPDDRAADVNVEIVVDHQSVASLVAGEFRQDLLDAGVCVDGNCSFSTSLWGAISSYEPHRVDVWAQDTTRGDWVLLSNSAKTLTCRTYDIYTYDTATGETRQITNLRDADEYNPNWSPNGNWIAHDVVRGDGAHGIYVTNVQTGVSRPLAGAEDGGNDAAWSPNSSLIAFDRHWVGDSSLYVTPPIGGRVRLVRGDAISPAWSPNGLRLAFHQPSDGSIRTMTLNGGGVKLVAASGEHPVWSPDGKWIAYEHDGDIWKVRVTLLGAPLGQPIQVTTVGTQEGHATWSADSQTIAFHSGIGRDFDIWTIPATGGMATWLTGAPGFGDYDPAYSKNGRYIAYGSFSPAGQAARTWVAAYTYDLPAGTWSEGEHRYHFETEWSGGDETPPPEFLFNVSSEAPSYDGYVLLRPYAVRARVDGECPAIDAIRPDQPTRFHVGYLSPEATYQEAQAFFDSLTARAVWDDGMSAELARHEIRPFSPDDWLQYVCTYTR
jgi:Tol biopolymer transport system component/regulation of enolase protein 1 (concanavalin A-like superfamily)